MIIKETYRVKTLWAILFIYPFLFIWQGGDLTDVGYNAIKYEFFFENFRRGDIDVQIFLAELVGASWNALFPGLGIIGYKFLYLIFLYVVIILIYKTFKNLTNKKSLLLVGILVGVVFLTRYHFLIFYYDTISFFCLILIALISLRAFNSGSNTYYFIAGIISMIAVIARIPNILILVIFPVLFIWDKLYNKMNPYHKVMNKEMIFHLLSYYFGVLIFGVFIIFLLKSLNYTEFILSGFRNFLNQTENSSYSVLSLLKIYIIDSIYFIPHFIIVPSVTIVGMLFYNIKFKRNVFFISYIILIVISAFVVYNGFSYLNLVKYLLPAFCLPAIIFSIIKKDKYSLYVLVFGAIGLVQVAGTNTGLFLKLGDSFVALAPLSLLIYYDANKVKFKGIVFNIRMITGFGFFLILMLSAYIRTGWIYHVSEGISERIGSVHKINHALMQGIYTNKDRAQYIEKLSAAIKKRMDADNTLIIYGHQPLFYYLTGNQPPVKTFWLANNVISAEAFFNSINESIMQTGQWPLIVDTKDDHLGPTGRMELENFINNHGYIIVEETGNFTIYKSIK